MRDCTIYVAKTKELISCAVTAQLICVFVVAYAKSRFSRDAGSYLHGAESCVQLLFYGLPARLPVITST